MKGDKFLVTYSARINNYVMICIGGEKEKVKLQQYIKARGSDEILMEVSEEEYERIRESIRVPHFI